MRCLSLVLLRLILSLWYSVSLLSGLAMPKDRPTTRKGHRKQQQENYLAGRASRPYRQTPALEKSFSDDEQSASDMTGLTTMSGAGPSTSTDSDATAGLTTTSGGGPSTSTDSDASRSDKVCSKCSPILSCYKDRFEQLVHQGSTRRRRVIRNPRPKRVDTQPYRDLVAQNAWLRSNIFDAMGNYIFLCQVCLCSIQGISSASC